MSELGDINSLDKRTVLYITNKTAIIHKKFANIVQMFNIFSYFETMGFTTIFVVLVGSTLGYNHWP